MFVISFFFFFFFAKWTWKLNLLSFTWSEWHTLNISYYMYLKSLSSVCKNLIQWKITKGQIRRMYTPMYGVSKVSSLSLHAHRYTHRTWTFSKNHSSMCLYAFRLVAWSQSSIVAEHRSGTNIRLKITSAVTKEENSDSRLSLLCFYEDYVLIHISSKHCHRMWLLNTE